MKKLGPVFLILVFCIAQAACVLAAVRWSQDYRGAVKTLSEAENRLQEQERTAPSESALEQLRTQIQTEISTVQDQVPDYISTAEALSKIRTVAEQANAKLTKVSFSDGSAAKSTSGARRPALIASVGITVPDSYAYRRFANLIQEGMPPAYTKVENLKQYEEPTPVSFTIEFYSRQGVVRP